MAELTVSILATAISAVVEKCKQIRAIPKIRDEALAVLINLTPIVDEIEPKLREKNHRQLIESLRAVLDEIENIADYIICNPTKAKLWSSTYLKKLRNAMHAVDGWVGRAQAITLSISHDTQSKIDELQEMTAACEISIGAEMTQVKEGLQHVVEHQDATLDEVQQVHKMLVEHCSIGKTDRFRQYLDDEDERLLQQVEAVAAKRAELPEHLICPLSKCLLEDPVMVTVSGNTYSKAMLNEHVSTRIRDGITVEDPISREEFDLKRDVVPNRAIADAIKNWKAKHFAYLKDVKNVEEMKDLVVDSTPYGDSLETCSEHNVDHHEIRLCHKQASEDARALIIKVKNTRVGNTYECEITEKEIVSGEIFEGHFPAVLASVDGFIEFFNDGLGVAANTEKGHSEIHCECNAHTDKYTIDIKTEIGSGWKKISFGTHLEVPLQSEPTPIEKLSLEMERMRLEMMGKIQELNERYDSKLIELSRENTELKSKTNDLERQTTEQKRPKNDRNISMAIARAARAAQKRNDQNFIFSKSFVGSKKGYVFKNGDKGLGYYLDGS